MRTIVLGLGNPILGDDGVGWHVIQDLRNQMAGQLAADVQVDVAEAAVGGLELMERLEGYECAILVDAIQTRDGVPGTLYRLTLEDLPTVHADSGHNASLKAALALGRQLGARLPDRIVIYAIEAANIREFGEGLSPQVAAGAGPAVQAVLAEVRSLAPQKG